MDRKKRALTQPTLNQVAMKKQRLCSSQNLNDKTLEEGQAGTITRVTLKNFMCHSHFELKFTKNINFLVGKNGSGKSAILTALVVGLGGRAADTHRGTSVKSFIKTGKSSALIEIGLKNTGVDAYKREQYGDEITISRTLNAGGGGNYKIKSSLGRVISQSAKELMNVLTYFNIQISNPVCILNQDTSREFLTSSNPRQVFKLYMKATGLENLKEEIEILQRDFSELKDVYNGKIETYKKLEENKTDLERKIEDYQNLDKLKEKFKEITVVLVWATIHKCEAQYREQEKVIGELQGKIDRYVDMRKNRTQRDAEIRARTAELEQQILEIKQSHSTQNNLLQDVDRQSRKLKQLLAEKRENEQQIAKETRTKQKSVEIVKKQIEHFTENLSKLEQEKIKRKNEMYAIQDKIKMAKEALETTENEMFQLKGNIHKIELEENDLSNEKGRVRANCERIRDDLSSLKMESADTLHLYGRYMPVVVRAIKQNERRFKKLPKGPFGSFIKLKDKKWAVAVESCLGGSLNMFAVDNVQDSKVLNEIFKQHWTSGRTPSIWTTEFSDKCYNVRQNLVNSPEDCTSVYEAIEVEDPVVLNALVDQLGIENVMLILSSQRAIELLSDRRRVPANCKRGITVTGDTFYPDPNYRTYASSNHQARYLQVDKAELIRSTEALLNETKDRMRTVERQLSAVTVEKDKQKAKLSDIVAKANKLKSNCFELRQRLDEYRSNDDQEPADFQSLDNEHSLLKDSLNELAARRERIETEIGQLGEDMRKLDETKRKLYLTVQGLEERVRPFEEEILRCARERDELNANGRVEKSRVKDIESRIEKENVKLRSLKDEIANRISLGGGEEKRVLPSMTSKELEAEADKINKKIKKSNSNVENIETMTRTYDNVVEKLTRSQEIINHLKKNLKELADSEKKRRNLYKHVQEYFSHFISHNFEQVMVYRQFKGRIDVSYVEQTLDLVVHPPQTSQERTITSNLSGGERSFSTVALLYSLWQTQKFPFYFLDEFDVFMDKVNRSKVMEILIHHAKQKPDLQFIFLTPQDVSFLRDDSISILRLSDPERNRAEN